MLKFFRNLPADKAGIRQKLLGENKIISPFRDLIWVEQTISQAPSVPLGTGYVGNPKTNHIAYLPTGQAGLRHARQIFNIFLYRYFVPTGHKSLKNFFTASNPQFLC